MQGRPVRTDLAIDVSEPCAGDRAPRSRTGRPQLRRAAGAVRARPRRAGRAPDVGQAGRRGARAGRRHDRGLRRRDVRRVDRAGPEPGRCSTRASRCCCASRPTPRSRPRSRGTLHGRTTRACRAARSRSSSSRSCPAPLVRRARRRARSPARCVGARRARSATTCADFDDGRCSTTPRPSWSRRTGATRRPCSTAALRPACPTSGSSPAASGARRWWPRSTVDDAERRPGAHARPASTSAPARREEVALSILAEIVAAAAAAVGTASRRRTGAGSRRGRPRVDPVCGMTVARRGVAAPRPRRRPVLVLRQRVPARLRRRSRRLPAP